MSVLLGVGAGVLGLENLWGVVFYFVGSAVGAFIFLTVTVGLGKQSIYFTKWTDMITSTLSTNLFVRPHSHVPLTSILPLGANTALLTDFCDDLDTVLRHCSCVCVNSANVQSE